jgi:hypothetical protein
LASALFWRESPPVAGGARFPPLFWFRLALPLGGAAAPLRGLLLVQPILAESLLRSGTQTFVPALLA